MKRRILNFLLLAVMLVVGTEAWGAGYTRTLSDKLAVSGYVVKQFYNFQNNTPAVLPTSGDVRFRAYEKGGFWGLHNFANGNRSSTLAIPIDEGDILVFQTYNTSSINSVSNATKDETLSESTGYLVYRVTNSAPNMTVNLAKSSGIVACLVMADRTKKTFIGKADNSTGFEGEWSPDYKINPSSALHLEFTNFTDRAENYHNWLLLLSPQDRAASLTAKDYYATLRADFWCWKDGADKNDNSWYTSYEAEGYDWDTFKNDMDGAKVVMDIVREGKKVTVSAVMTTTANKTMKQTYVMDCGDGTQYLYAALSVDNAHLVVDNATAKVKGGTGCDFENSETLFTATGRVTLANASDPSDATNNVLKFTSANNAGNVAPGALAMYDFTTLSDAASQVDVTFDCYIPQISGQCKVTIGDATQRPASIFNTNGSWGSKTAGAIFSFGTERGKLSGNNENYASHNGNAIGSTTTLKAADVLNKWLTINAVINMKDKKVSYTISERGSATPLVSVVDANFLDWDSKNDKATATTAAACSQIDIQTGVNSVNAYFDNLSIKTIVPTAKPTTYTMNFISDDDDATPGTVLKTQKTFEYILNVGDEAKASAEDMHLFDEGDPYTTGTRWIYTESDTIILEDEELPNTLNVINVKFHKANYYDWRVVGKYGDKKVFDIETGNALEGDTLDVTYRQFYKDAVGAWYKTALAADGRSVYRFPIIKQKTLTTEQVDTVYYTPVGDVEMIEEIEDRAGVYTFANENCSGGMAAYTGDDFVKVSDVMLEPGKYKMTVATCDVKDKSAKPKVSGDWFEFQAIPRGSVIPKEEVLRLTPKAVNVNVAEYEFTVKVASYLYMKGGEDQVGIDYLTVVSSGGLPEAVGYINLVDSVADVITEPFVVHAEEFDVYISNGKKVEYKGKTYFEISDGTLQVQCTTGKCVKAVDFLQRPKKTYWEYCTASVGQMDVQNASWKLNEGYDNVIFTFTKPVLIAGIGIGGALPSAEIYYSEDFEGDKASTDGWTSSVDGRYTPELLSDNGTRYISVNQDSRYNNGAVVTGTVLKDKLPEGITDFTLKFDMRLGGTNQQLSNLQFLDSEGKAMLKLSLTGASSSVWSINDKADKTLDFKNSAYKSGGRKIEEIDWYTFQISHSGSLNYLSVTHKDTGDNLLDKEPIESEAVAGGVGNIVFTSARYFANIAFDNIVLRELMEDYDLPEVETAEYTLKFVAENGDVIREDYVNEAIVGNKLAASEEWVKPIYANDKKYFYVSGNDSILVVDNPDANILTLVFREAAVYNYTARASSGDGILAVFERSTGFEDDVITVAYPRYVLDKKGRLWARDAESSQYRTTATLTKDKQMINLAYDLPAEAIENVIFYSEGENLTDALKSNAANTVIRSSNAGAGFYTEDTKILTLKPGSYTITAVGFFGASAGGSIKFTDGTQTLFMVSSTGASNGTGATGEIELTEVTPIYLAAGSNTVCLDYFYIQTEDGGIATDGIADVKAGYEQGAVYNLKGQKVADSLEGLQPGLYLVNGKKVTVK